MFVVVFIMYWGLVHLDHLNEIRTVYKGNDELIAIKEFHTYIVHSVPCVCAFVLLKISDTVLIRRHWQGLVFFGLIYAYSNYKTVIAQGKPLYWFLTWEDHWSLIVVAATITVFCSMFYGTARYDEYTTKRSSLRGIYPENEK